MGRVLWGVVALCAVALGCAGKSNDAAIGVTVTLAADTPITCVRVQITPASAPAQLSDGIEVKGRTSLHVAIFRGGDLKGDVSLLARGFVGKGCEDSAFAYEDSEAVAASFKDGEVTQVTLALAGRVSGDEDGDGYRSTQSGGDDCDDQNKDVHPGATEVCDNGRDDDCAGGADCVDSACSGHACDDGDACTSGEACENSLCQGGVELSCNQPPDECHAATGSCTAGACTYPVLTGSACAQGFCKSDGTCAPPGTETVCSNGIDDDLDGKPDCLDPDCDQQSCDDDDVCTRPDLCSLDAGSCVATPVTCSTPPNGCFDAVGACGADGGCGYSQHAAGSSCGSGMECGTDGGCNAIETGALCNDGLDNDQDGVIDCADPSCDQIACNDSNACTSSDKCGSGTCGGTAVTCTPPTCMTANGACNPNSGCSYSVTPGAACPGGTCAADAGCTPFFGYTPSNFNPTTVSSPGVNAVINCNTPIINTNDNTITGWCSGVPQPATQDITLSNGDHAAGYVFDSLQIGSGGAIRFIGQKAAILIVLGNATVSGTLNVSADRDSSRGAGGSYPAGFSGGPETHCGSGTGNSGSTSTTTGGGGGGAFGGAGGNAGSGASGGSGGTGGQAISNASLVPLRGGCAGGNGGQTNGAHGGIGGGAIQISATGTLTVNGKISAGGGGGRGGKTGEAGGAGGGGSGGAILLEGSSVSIGATALITANGGAGGEGSGGSTFDGDDGSNANDNSSNVTPGANGQTTGRGGPGGAGAAGTSSTGGTGTGGNSATGNGGGGGGGVGKIRINAQTGCTLTSGRVISPPATSNKAGSSGCP